MIYPKTRMAALVMTIAIALSGCSLFKSSSAPNDEAIVSSIQSKLYQDPVLKTRDIRVVSQQGVVVLTGNVGSDQEKSQIEQLAHSTDGVKQVVDELALNSSDDQASQAPGQPEGQSSGSQSNSMARNAPSGGSSAPAPVEQAPPDSSQEASNTPPPAPQPYPVSIPAGTVITVRTVDSINSSINRTGDEFAATVDSPISADGQVVIPRYSKARLRLVAERSAGHIKGQSEVQLEMVRLTVNGKTYPVSTGVFVEKASSSRGSQTAKRVGIGAAVGGIIGAIAGGGKGAAIGAGVGAGAGTGVQMATKAKAVKIPSETKLDFNLRKPLTVTVNP
jgi:uncharacterized protein YcfJ